MYGVKLTKKNKLSEESQYQFYIEKIVVLFYDTEYALEYYHGTCPTIILIKRLLYVLNILVLN